jgi:hypothetical protein
LFSLRPVILRETLPSLGSGRQILDLKTIGMSLSIDVGPAIFAVERKLDECGKDLQFLVDTCAQDHCDEDVLDADVVEVLK